MASNPTIFNAISGSSYITIFGTSYPTTAMNHSKKADKIDTTDGSTATGFKDSVKGRSEVTFTSDLIANSTNYKLSTSTSGSIALNYASGLVVSGSGSLDSLDIKGSTNNYIVLSIAGTFTGQVSEA